MNGKAKYEVEKILASNIHWKLQYKVKWVGYDKDPQWYDTQNLRNSPLALHDFHRDNLQAPGPPKNPDYWLKCAEDDEDPEDRIDDNQPVA